MDSKEIKTKLLHFYRFRRSFKFIATEAGRWESDVLVSDEKEVIEIEVKISLIDFKNDFKKKKHSVYSNPVTPYQKTHVPNKFFFCVPQNLADAVEILLKDSPYGLLVCLPGAITRKGVFIKSVKTAKNLREGISKKLLHSLQLRMGSELIRTRIKELELA